MLPWLTHCSVVTYAGRKVLMYKYEGDTAWRSLPLEGAR